MRVGIIGYGMIGEIYDSILSSLDWVEVCGIVEKDEGKRNKISAASKVKLFSDYQELIETAKPDVIFICTPIIFHEEIARYAIERNIHTLCEKPLAIDVHKSLELYKLAKEKGIYHTTGLQYILDPVVIEAKNMIESGALGDLYYMRAILDEGGSYRVDWSDYALKGIVPSDPRISWRFDKSKGGGVLFESGCHMVNVARFLFGDLKKIVAFKAPSGDQCGDILTQTVAVFDKIPQGSFTVSYFGRSIGHNFEFEIIGSKGQCVVRPFLDLTYFPKSSDKEEKKNAGPLLMKLLMKYGEKYKALRLMHTTEKINDMSKSMDFPGRDFLRIWAWGIAENTIRFLIGIKEKRQIVPSFFEAVKAQEVAEAVYLSCREGRAVELPLLDY